MSYHSINLQASIPRTPEAGMLQNQTLHKPVADQTHMAAETVKETDAKRTQNEAVDKSAEMHIRDEGRQPGSQRERKKRNGPGKEQEQAEQQIRHPFKGKHIDISL